MHLERPLLTSHQPELIDDLLETTAPPLLKIVAVAPEVIASPAVMTENAQLESLVSELLAEGLLDEQFSQLMQLQDDTNPHFVAEVRIPVIAPAALDRALVRACDASIIAPLLVYRRGRGPRHTAPVQPWQLCAR